VAIQQAAVATQQSVGRNTQLAADRIADIQRLPTAVLLAVNGFLVPISPTAAVGVWLIKAWRVPALLRSCGQDNYGRI